MALVLLHVIEWFRLPVLHFMHQNKWLISSFAWLWRRFQYWRKYVIPLYLLFLSSNLAIASKTAWYQ